MISINIWALLGCLYTLILEFSLHCLFLNFLYLSPFLFSATSSNIGGACYCGLVFNFILRFSFWEESPSHASGKAKALKTRPDNTLLEVEWIFKKER